MDQVKDMLRQWLAARSAQELADYARLLNSQRARDEEVIAARRRAGWPDPYAR